MPDQNQPWVAEETRSCLDPECPGQMEPEQDGDHRYWACTTCGYEGGYEKSAGSVSVCSAGVPQVRPEPVPLLLGMPTVRRSGD